MKEKKFYCPIADWSCPYYKADDSCELGKNAFEECDDAAFYYDEKEEE